ncbi:hypothetical protein ESZ53_04180 [Salinibacterium sp. UTAS2018]|uniref:hypothetical protein n=1 Tax=Salinibacterium sp. UTAS2018 TaxID=2508880 RepID=UPI0010097EEF|nr:hypothetical protein [Salinibacterium sp. UTAS2018]QAV69707.1 hypothetical protein ESZ53_04180 [Salinibacterium sp. UTAS2018]
MHTRAMRVLRGSIAAFFATFTAAFSHQFAGGVTPSLFGMGVSLVISISICTLLAGRTISLARLSIAIAASQAMYHALFSSMLVPAGIAQHNMAAMTFDFSSAAQSADSAMSLSHVVAAAVTVIAFRYAEVAFWGLFDTARMFISRLFISVSLVATPVLEFRLEPRSAPVVQLVARFLAITRYRGPPAALAAV